MTPPGGGPPESLRVVRPSRASQEQRTRDRIGLLDRDAPIPSRVEVPFEDGLDCEAATCLLVGSQLLLVPPETARPLPDRVPRDAEGMPLLSDDCALSSKLFCDDYAERRGCRCEREAAYSPQSCRDVSQFECEGSFQQREGEWPLEEVAHAGCSCTAVDPNQPATFGDECTREESHCAEPFGCVDVTLPTTDFAPPDARVMCTAACNEDADCPSWEATGFCAASVQLACADGYCLPRTCD